MNRSSSSCKFSQVRIASIDMGTSPSIIFVSRLPAYLVLLYPWMMLLSVSSMVVKRCHDFSIPLDSMLFFHQVCKYSTNITRLLKSNFVRPIDFTNQVGYVSKSCRPMNDLPIIYEGWWNDPYQMYMRKDLSVIARPFWGDHFNPYRYAFVLSPPLSNFMSYGRS